MPTLVPAADESTVYLVLEDFDKLGQAWRETDIRHANESAVIKGILSGEYEHPLRVVAFNVEQGWALDVTADIALKALDAAQAQDRALIASARAFIERAGHTVPESV